MMNNIDQPLSLLDKLSETDLEYPTNNFYENIRCDLETLLNTRRRSLSWDKHLTQLDKSLYAYGVQDFTNNFLEDHDGLKQFCENLAQIIKRFEPRFKEVNVLALKEAKEDRVLRLRIDALLQGNPNPEPIIFNSVMDPKSQTFSLRQSPN